MRFRCELFLWAKIKTFFKNEEDFSKIYHNFASNIFYDFFVQAFVISI